MATSSGGTYLAEMGAFVDKPMDASGAYARKLPNTGARGAVAGRAERQLSRSEIDLGDAVAPAVNGPGTGT